MEAKIENYKKIKNYLQKQIIRQHKVVQIARDYDWGFTPIIDLRESRVGIYFYFHNCHRCSYGELKYIFPKSMCQDFTEAHWEKIKKLQTGNFRYSGIYYDHYKNLACIHFRSDSKFLLKYAGINSKELFNEFKEKGLKILKESIDEVTQTLIEINESIITLEDIILQWNSLAETNDTL